MWVVRSAAPAETAPGFEGFGAPAYRAFVLAALFVVYTFNFMDRQILSTLTEPIRNRVFLAGEAVATPAAARARRGGRGPGAPGGRARDDVDEPVGGRDQRAHLLAGDPHFVIVDEGPGRPPVKVGVPITDLASGRKPLPARCLRRAASNREPS